MKITINRGHSAGSPGASGNGYKEHIVATEFKDALIRAFNSVGVSCVDTTSDAATSNAVLKEQANKANAVSRDLDISIHLNAGGGQGCEVLYYDAVDLASKVSNAIAQAGGFKNRGAKKRTDLYFLRTTKQKAILIELCFIDSAEDMKKLYANKDKIVNAIVTSITGKVVQAPAPTPVVNTSGKLYRVQIGAYANKENAQRICEKLQKEGYPAIIKFE